VQACSKNIYSSSLRSNHWRVEVAYQYPGAYKFQQQLHRIKRVYPLLVSQYRDAANTLLHHSLIIRMLLIRTLLMTPPAAQSRHVLSVTFAVPLEPGRFLLQLHHSFTESDGSATVIEPADVAGVDAQKDASIARSMAQYVFSSLPSSPE
jgi:hypothetical protein